MKLCKQIMALILAILLGCLAGCGRGMEYGTEMTDPSSSTATGRYVERDIPLPEDGYARDLVMLATGQLRIAIEDEHKTIHLYTSGANPGDWGQPQALPDEILKSGEIETLALSVDGAVFCNTVQKNAAAETRLPHFWYVEPSGKTREILVSYPKQDVEDNSLVSACDFTNDGQLIVLFLGNDLREIDLETGSLSKNHNELEPYIFGFSCAGADSYMLGVNGTASVYREGKTEAVSGVLSEKLSESMEATSGYFPKITFWENEQGYLFFTTHDGLFSFVPGGSVIEELVDGTSTTLGSPSFFPRCLTGSEDNSFFVLGDNGEDSVLYHYVYDAETLTVPNNQLRLYSLYEDENLRQMIAQYQKAHPELSINLEIGLTGENGVTVADAIRTLNTKILAGDGPDLLQLDGLSLETYQEKGLLIDLHGWMDQAEPLLENVTNCYEADGKICAIPTSFAIPAIYGPEHIVSQIHDLDSLTAAANQAQTEYPEISSVLGGFYPLTLADNFYDSCSAAWTNADGTLDGEKLTAYYAAMQTLYALDEGWRQENAELLKEVTAREGYYIPGDYTGISGAMTVCSGEQCMTPGTLDGMEQWAKALAGDEALSSYETVPISLQASNVFLPRRVMGILSTSTCQDTAGDFLVFMLSQDVQSKELTTGFPVNRSAFDREITEERDFDMTRSTSDGNGNRLSFQVYYPNVQRRQALKSWVEGLTTPALTDRIIRDMVMGQVDSCLTGGISPEQATQTVLSSLNLYLSE